MPLPTPAPRLPPQLTGDTQVLISRINLPPSPTILYAEYRAAGDHQQQHKILDLARQRIVTGARQNSKNILDSLLPIVCIGKEDAKLWIFAIGSENDNNDQRCGGQMETEPGTGVREELEAFFFDGLQRIQLFSFTPSTLYPYSSECTNSESPYSSSSRTNVDQSTPMQSASSPPFVFPRAPLKSIYTIFVDAIRDRLIDDICANSVDSKAVTIESRTSCRASRATRLGNGFLCIDNDISPTWGTGWHHRSQRRTLVHTMLQVSLSLSAIHLRPLPAITTLVPLPVSQHSVSSQSTNTTSAPTVPTLVPGLPLVLAPYQTPAFYMSTHHRNSVSPTLLCQFWDAMAGLGAYPLSTSSRVTSPRSGPLPSTHKSTSFMSNSSLLQETLVLVFIPLSNPQGEPKGLSALWPAHLVFVDSSPYRAHLPNLPEIPGMEALLTPPRASASQTIVQPSLASVNPPRFHRGYSSSRSYGHRSRSQRVFRALELLSHKRVPGVPVPVIAKHAAGYVENVAREREKERERANQERMRRERDLKEGKSSGPGPPAPTTASTDASRVSQAPANTPAASPSKAHGGLLRPSSSSSVLSTFFAKAAQGTEANSFYPSPPDWDPVTSTSGPGTTEVSSLVPNGSPSSHPAIDVNSTSSQPQASSNVASQVIDEALGLGNGMNLGMDIDMNMNIGINLGGSIGFDMNADMDAAGTMDGTFGAFTDDDFNYFDTAPAGLPLSTPHIPPSLRELGAEDGTVDGWLPNGLQQDNTDATESLQHNTALQEETPVSMEIDITGHDPLIASRMNDVHIPEDGEFIPLAPELISSSPARSPWSPGNPPTPSLEFNVPPAVASGKDMFEPIAFGKSHWLADGKYVNMSGKFTFPQQSHYSPRLDMFPGSPSSLTSDTDDGWKPRYDAVTDPRVRVVERLRGVKRKVRVERGKAVARDEEWANLYYRDEDTDLSDSSSSQSDNEAEEPECGRDRDDVSCDSRPSCPNTPPPTGHPLMATLLYTHFHHAHLLPMSVPMRTPYGDVTSPTDSLPVPISVPTPVSPAAGLVNASDRTKNIEILAQAIAKEAVENDVWMEATAISRDVLPEEDTSSPGRKVAQTDLRRISELFGKVACLEGCIPLSELLDRSFPSLGTSANPSSAQDNKPQLMHPPRFSIGRAGLVHHMLPSAIRFWEKEGLGPRGGTKDVVAFVLFEEGEERSALVERWLERVSRAYSARGLGTHVAGRAGAFERGLVPLQFEAVRKTLPNLMLDLPTEPSHVVLYVIAPSSVSLCLKSPALRSIILSQKRVSKLARQHDFAQGRVLVHFVPEYLIADPHMYPNTRYVGLERFVTLVYDRLPRQTLRQTSRQFWKYNPPFESWFQVPAFVLARKAAPQTHFEWDEEPSLDVLDRHAFIHVGYRVSACGKWLIAACVDERGEAHDVGVWGIPEPAINVSWVVSNIWMFVKQFAQQAYTEWRIVIAKLGEMCENEVEEWIMHLETRAPEYPGQRLHVSLVCAQNDVPLLFIPDATNKTSPSVTTNSGSVFTDVSSATYSAFISQVTPIVTPDLTCPTTNHLSSVEPTVSDDDSGQSLSKSPIGVLPLSTAALLHVPNETDLTTVSTLYIHILHTYKSAKSTLKQKIREIHADITRNWYELAVLTRERWHFVDHEELPFHLAALQVISDALRPLVSTLDMPMKDGEFLGG